MKIRYYIPCTVKEVAKGTSAPAMARLFLDCVFRLHGLPETIVLDHGPQFISSFWEYLTTSLGVKRTLSTAHHPQTDGQTERTNQDLKNYLPGYISWKQDDWACWLSVAEFAANAASSATTGISTSHAVMDTSPAWTLTSPRANQCNDHSSYRVNRVPIDFHEYICVDT